MADNEPAAKRGRWTAEAVDEGYDMLSDVIYRVGKGGLANSARVYPAVVCGIYDHVPEARDRVVRELVRNFDEGCGPLLRQIAHAHTPEDFLHVALMQDDTLFVGDHLVTEMPELDVAAVWWRSLGGQRQAAAPWFISRLPPSTPEYADAVGQTTTDEVIDAVRTGYYLRDAKAAAAVLRAVKRTDPLTDAERKKLQTRPPHTTHGDFDAFVAAVLREFSEN
jgi:hypothetical protein